MKYYTPISFASSSGDNESTRVFFSLFVSLSLLSFFLSLPLSSSFPPRSQRSESFSGIK